jgi:hypothetical protein
LGEFEGHYQDRTTSASPRSEQTSGICDNFDCLCPYPSRFRAMYVEFGTTCARKLFFPPKACTHRSKRKLQNSAMIAATCARNTHTSTTTSTSGCINTSTTTRHSAARALRQPCRAPQVLVSRPQRLYIDYAVRRLDVVFWAYDYFDYSSRLVSTRKLVEDGSHDINN